jgi:peroxiredoxin
MAEVLSTFLLRPGLPFPEFSLPDAYGRVFTRAEASGPNGLVVVFACNHCPFVIHLADALGDLARDIRNFGVHTVAINSNDPQRYPQDAPDLMKDFATDHRWDFPYLIDETQSVAKAYGAACTPDFFLADAGGCLFYTGQFDDSRPRGGKPAHGGDLMEAVRRLLAGENGLARPYPSSGCNIKWKPGNEPVWAGGQ